MTLSGVAPRTGVRCRSLWRAGGRPEGAAGSGCPLPAIFLAAQAELLDQGLIATLVLALQVVEQAAALRNQSEQTTTGMVVLLVVLEVLGQVADALGKDRHLDFRRAGVALGGREFLDEFLDR